METVFFCGGKGTRMKGFGDIPKALVPIGHAPLLWHCMHYYALSGHTIFHLCLGHNGAQISAYAETHTPPGWTINTVETGEESTTLGRLHQMKDIVRGDQFFLTYGDGIADVDLAALLAFHRSHKKLMTVTGIRRRSRFGILTHAPSGEVTAFCEKPCMPENERISGGFFVCNREILTFIPSDTRESLECSFLPLLARMSELVVYRHDGFWQCMDDYHDWLLLTESYEQGGRLWLRS